MNNKSLKQVGAKITPQPKKIGTIKLTKKTALVVPRNLRNRLIA